ncbi:heat shock factor protein 1 [Puma concolor]|uniref:Heat shock factor protein 1 n=2 Tax=Laurasiatheria TaxID=314145 RepID=A0A6P6HSC7_PUMCO|nr:heat shock factor protein 1 [Puma concolor]
MYRSAFLNGPHLAVSSGSPVTWSDALLPYQETALVSASAASLRDGSDSGLSESEESVFSGLQDSGSDSSEDDPAEGEDGASGDDSHSRMEETSGQQVQDPAPHPKALPAEAGLANLLGSFWIEVRKKMGVTVPGLQQGTRRSGGTGHIWGLVPRGLRVTLPRASQQSGNSFHVFDQGQFAKEVLPKYFKHNNMASFVRQLNMYGFRKVVHIEQGGLVKPERDDTEFQHPCFLRGQEQLLENIKRKVTSVSTLKNEDIKIRQDSVTKLLTDVQLMKGKQESMDSKLLAMKHENEALWREVASLRQKHAQQQKVVNKLIQFLISLVQSNRILGVKRKIPLMLNDSSAAHSMPKYGRQYSLEHIHGSGPYSAPSPAYSSSSLYSPDTVANSGPIISDITELAPGSPLASPGGSIDERPVSSSPLVRVKEEPPSPPRSPRVEEASPGHPSSVVEIPLSPTALIDSILRESEPAPAAPATPLTDAGGRRPSPPPPPASAPEKCLSVACLDNLARAPQMSGVARLFPCPSSLHGRVQPGTELSDHLDAMDSNLDNLQTMLTSHGFSGAFPIPHPHRGNSTIAKGKEDVELNSLNITMVPCPAMFQDTAPQETRA